MACLRAGKWPCWQVAARSASGRAFGKRPRRVAVLALGKWPCWQVAVRPAKAVLASGRSTFRSSSIPPGPVDYYFGFFILSAALVLFYRYVDRADFISCYHLCLPQRRSLTLSF